MATPEDQTNKFADEEEQQEVGLEDDPSGKRTEGEEEIAPLLVPSGVKLKPYQRLVTEDNVFAWSLWAMRLGVLADSINSTILRPNYPFLVTPGARVRSNQPTVKFVHAYNHRSSLTNIPFLRQLTGCLSVDVSLWLLVCSILSSHDVAARYCHCGHVCWRLVRSHRSSPSYACLRWVWSDW